MGEAERADEALIPDFAWLADGNGSRCAAPRCAEGHYELYSDNILDLAHANFVHPALAANAWTVGKRRFRQRATGHGPNISRPNDYLSEAMAYVRRAGRGRSISGAACAGRRRPPSSSISAPAMSARRSRR